MRLKSDKDFAKRQFSPTTEMSDDEHQVSIGDEQELESHIQKWSGPCMQITFNLLHFVTIQIVHDI